MIINRKANIRKRNTENHSRLNFIVAIIFLSACVLIGRLFNLQVLNYDLYTALASDQHLVFSELEPNRGRIYYQDNQAGEEEKLYPVATNKEFALT